MSSMSVAQALLHAYRDRFTGFVRICWGGRTSSLALRGGDLVGVDVRFGSQSWAQALLQSGRIAPGALDELWARGALAAVVPDHKVLAEVGVPRDDAESARVLANVRQMSSAGARVELEPKEVEPRFHLPGTRAVRAAFEALDQGPLGQGLYRCVDAAACAEWCESDDELELVSQLAWLETPPALDPPRRALLRVLALEGSIEPREPVDSAEASTAAHEPVDGTAEAVASDSSGEAIEASAEAIEAIAPDLPIALAEEDVDTAEIAGDWWEGIPTALELSEEEIEVAAEAPRTAAWAEDPDPKALADARRRVQDELSHEVNEALRRAGAASAEPWLDGGDQDRRAGVPIPNLSTDAWEAGVPPLEEALIAAEPTWVGSPPTSAEADDSPSASIHTDHALAEDWRLHHEEHLATDPSDPAEAARLRRQRLLRKAMENMGTLPRPERHQNAEPVAAPAPAAPTEPAAAPAPAAPSNAASADERKIAASIEERYRALSAKPTHFAVLGVSQSATREQVKAAFLELAKSFHPDRLPAALSSLAPKMTSIFEAIREAYEVLYDDRRRAEYAEALQQKAQAPKGAPEPNAVAQASEEFKKGEALFRKRDFARAEEHYTRAHGLDPRADYLAARAWAIYMDPERKQEAGRAKQMIRDALKANAGCDRAHYQLGLIARMDNDIPAAERHFREAVKANPRHLEANQELRLIEMRKKKSGKKGLFG